MYEGLYKIVSQEKDRIRICLSDHTHPIFQAHFPGNPLLPGFIHFEIIADIFDLEITEIKKAKFISPVLPLQEVVYTKNGNKFKVSIDDKVVATFSL